MNHVVKTNPGSKSALNQTRWMVAESGVLALLALGFVSEGSLADRLALFALIALSLATVLTAVQVLRERQAHATTADVGLSSGSREWLIGAGAIALASALAAQSWFRAGTSIGSGDIVLPDGTAWIGRLFEPWTWGGSNLGEASQLPLALPWAVILGLVHAVGGDPGLAQRIWYTALFAGAALGAYGFLWALRLGPLAAFVGAVVYVLNPFVISSVNANPVFLAALTPLAVLPGALLAAGTGRLSVRRSALVIAAMAPLVGYVFANPPLVGMVLITTLAVPLLLAWLDGREAAGRSVRALGLAVPLLLALSAYWIVPAGLHLRGFSGGELTSIASWNWTEARATIRNAFWLNDTWGWAYPQYYPYASAYDRFPLSFARFILPAVAFGALAIGAAHGGWEAGLRRNRLRRMSAAAAAVALPLIFLSTGTNPPGNVVFEILYNLPFGWLLREPGRFLMLATLAYAVLTAVTVEALSRFVRFTEIWPPSAPVQLSMFQQPANEFIRSWHPRLRTGAPALRLSVVPVAVATSVLLGFPMYTGAVVPDNRPILPPSHVQMPAYWRQMAAFVDQMPTHGGILVLPPDDFYAMPYSWGYYGTDSFVVDLFRRPVLVPNVQGGYIPTSAQVFSAVNLTADSLLHHEWGEAQALVTALDTPFILVRHDINWAFPGRSILAPGSLAQALDTAPNFALVKKIGALDLYVLTKAVLESEVTTQYLTVNTMTPDLRLLRLLPPNTALVTADPLAGVPNVIYAPPWERWQTDGPAAFWQPSAPSGMAYRIADLESGTVTPLASKGTVAFGASGASAKYDPGAAGDVVTVSMTGRTVLANGTFSEGPWGLVGDCRALAKESGQPTLGAKVIGGVAPGGLPALELSADKSSACVGQPLSWRGGLLLVSLMVKRIQGTEPRVCLFETGPEHCLVTPDIPKKSGWFEYRMAVTPDPGTTAITLYLYAQAGSANRTVDQYANIRIVELPSLPPLVLLADPPERANTISQLLVGHHSFSDLWRPSTAANHVLVDGMLNGWLTPTGSQVVASYWPESLFRGAGDLSIGALVVWIFVALLPVVRNRVGSRLRWKRRSRRGIGDQWRV